MYTNVIEKTAKQTLIDIIEGDVDDFRKASPNLKVEDAKAVELGKAKSATVKYFSGDANGNFEAIAYIEEAKVVVLVVLSSRTRKDLDQSLSAFKELVGSYFFMSDKVVIEK